MDEDRGLKFTRSVDESKSINDVPSPAVVISASGMCEAGRIRHHLANNINDKRNLVLVVGYMAKNTLGRKIVDGESPVNIFGEPHDVQAEVLIFNAFSGHADQKGLLRFANDSKAQQLFLVHGEDDSMQTFRTELNHQSALKQSKVTIPCPGEIFELKANKQWKKLHYKNAISQQLFPDRIDEI
jgi:metallo-beta-lactamase family protein